MTPPVVATVEGIRQAVGEARQRGLTVGLVPTMGALHEGHLSLCRAARAETGFVVATIFVNPTQFGPNEDFARYPRQLETDRDLCGQAGVDVIFAPEVPTMYPADFHTFVEVLDLSAGLCGASRPGHFRGVTTVVLKLFNIVGADVAYFGQKDFQQARLIQQMVHDLNVPLQVRICPIVREPDGLAMSSRNQYLDPTQRRHAVALSQALQAAQRKMEEGERDPEAIRGLLVHRIADTPGAVLDYAAVVDADRLQPLPRLQGVVLLALAVKFGATRLIDNILVQVRDSQRPMK